MQELLEILIRTVAALVLLLIIAKVLGKQTISNMTFHDFVTSITLGAIAANLAFNEKLNWSFMTLALVVFTATSYLLSVLALKNPKWRKWVSGAPTVIIENGKILEDNMKKVRYTLDSLNQSLREKGIFDIEEVSYAMLEDHGKLSVLKKEPFQPLTRRDLDKMSTGASPSFPVELIMDGKVMENNLHSSGLTRQWLEKELAGKGKRVSDVFYAVRGTHQKVVFDYYDDQLQHPLDTE